MTPTIPFDANNPTNKSAWPIITGQDGMDIAITNIYYGAQEQTVFKDTFLLSEKTTALLKEVAEGKTPTSKDNPMNNGVKDVPTWLMRSVELVKEPTGDQKGIEHVVETGFMTEEQFKKNIKAPIIE